MDIWKPEGILAELSDGDTVIVDNRMFLLGLDELYRTSMKQFEVWSLLPCARELAQTLQIQQADVPVEGYYADSPELTEYFLLMRGLQQVREENEVRVKETEAFQLLWEVTSSLIYGRPQRKGKLFSVGRDPLTQALYDLIPDWNVPRLVEAAHAVAMQYDDFSLVGLAARARDAVVLAALRESVVLYAEVVSFGIHKEPTFNYEWRVDEALATAANRFIEAFNHLVSRMSRSLSLPAAESSNAERFYKAYTDNEIIGRCVRIGQTEDGSKSYHWAIFTRPVSSGTLELAVDDFWSNRLWTTEEYRRYQHTPMNMRPFSKYGAPTDQATGKRSQRELWSEVNRIKRKVRDVLGSDLSHEQRSDQIYQAYAGLCGEAQMAYEDGELDDEIVGMLDEYAEKVLASCRPTLF